MAGLVCYYNGAKFHYLYLCRDDVHGKHLRVMSALPDKPSANAFSDPIPVHFEGPLELRAEIRLDTLRFAWRSPGNDWNWLPRSFGASILSDEATAPGLPNFRGAFVGMACQDLSSSARSADFAWFEYLEQRP
jgi:xylan 1,4-beta-xylosidase